MTTIEDQEFFFQKISGPSGKNYVVIQDSPREHRPRIMFFAASGYTIFGIFLLVTTFLCYLLARSFASPVLEIRAASQKFSNGELHARIPAVVAARNDELGDLALGFNEMAERLEIMMGRQKTLLHEISHELRSPLARMKIALELIRKNQDQEQMVSRLEQETDRMEEMIGQILTLTKLEDKTSNLESRHLDVKKLVENVMTDAQFEAGKDDDRISWHCSEQTPLVVLGIEDLLCRAVENVIRNALKFSPPQTPIDVAISIEEQGKGKNVQITVADRGPGVPPEHLSRIFEPFYRCQEDRSRKTGGIGLGLAITRRALERFGGAVVAENRSDGGLLVTMTLPLAC